MFRRFLMCLFGLTIACGGVVEDDSLPFRDDEILEAEELGQSEQAFNAPVTVNSQFGTQTGSARNRCNRTSSGQVCSVPSFHNVLWCNDPNFGEVARSRVTVLMNALDTLLTTRTFSQPETLPFGLCDFQAANIVFTRSAVGSSGTASNDIANYSRPDFQGVVGLTENGQPGEPAVVGSYQSHSRCDIRIDEADIFAKGTNATQDQRYLDHAVVNGVIACLGKGRTTGVSAFNRAMQHDMSSTHANDTLTAGELCQLNSYNAVNNGNFANAGNCGND